MNPQRQEGNKRKLHENPNGKTMILLCFVTFNASERINIKWFLRVYWLLPLSIVDYFKKHRRFFCRAPTILLESIDDSFAEHRWILGPVNQLHFPKVSFPYFNGLFFSSLTNQQTAWQKSYRINRHLPTRPSCLCWQNGPIGHAELGWFVRPCQDMCLHYWRTGINETESLPWLASYNMKGNDSGIYSNCYFLSHLKIDWLGLNFLKE